MTNMILKQLYFPDNGDSLKLKFRTTNGHSSPGESIIEDSDKAMHEMKEINTHLQELRDKEAQELSEIMETNNKFISIVAHDLRSPFCSILDILEILKRSLNNYNVGEIENYIDVASDSANRTLNLLDNLLAWTFAQNPSKRKTVQSGKD